MMLLKILKFNLKKKVISFCAALNSCDYCVVLKNSHTNVTF